MKYFGMPALICIALLSLCGPSAAHARKSAAEADQAAAGDVEIHKIRPGVWVHTSYYTYPDGARVPSNGMIVRHGDGLLLVDTAWGELLTVNLLNEVANQIALPIRTAVITHFHYDRLAGVGVLKRHGIEVLALPMTQRLAAQEGMPVPGNTLAGLSEPGNTIRIGPVEVFYPGPGHSLDNLMVWVPAQKVLFGGCTVRGLAAKSLGNTADADLAAWPLAIRRAQAHYPEARIVIPGHGDAGGSDLMRHTLSLFKD